MKRSIRNMLERVGGVGRRGPAAFTLIELLIAVGALAIIAAGVAAIFEATGRTVQAGRRVSAMASYASLIERRMRDDFASMTRDGFLIIRTEYAVGRGLVNGGDYPNILAPGLPNDDAVPLTETDEHPRLRRTDEIMFFVKGQFVSLRELLDPRFVAKADAAALYYGHGQRALPPIGGYGTGSSHYYNPEVGDEATTYDPQGYSRLGYQGAPAGTQNPNQYASDWILVRHLTLLRQAQTGAVPIPAQLQFGLTAQQVPDSDIQVGLQPAASNLFRDLAHINFTTPTAPSVGVRQSFDTGWLHPLRASGLVDIATTDLSEIRAIITTADTWPGASTGTTGNPAGSGFFDPATNIRADGGNKGVDGVARVGGAGGDVDLILREQAWMSDALPAFSTADAGSVTQRQRIRCELAPNNFVGVLGLPPGTPEQPSRRADQIMLSASNFLPHCTEFIVEWSFGVQYPSDPNDPNFDPVTGAANAGKLVWYGLPRAVNGQLVANTYYVPLNPPPTIPMPTTAPWYKPFGMPYTRVNGTQASVLVSEGLIHGANFGGAQPNGQQVTSYFGYNDPNFNPDKDTPNGTTAAAVPPGGQPFDGKLISPLDSRSPTIPWAWPRYIRVTLSLADPNNPSVEQSFQFVFDVPSEAAQ